MIGLIVVRKEVACLIVNISFVTCGDYYIKYTNARITIHTWCASVLVILRKLVGALGTFIKYR